MVVRLTYWVNSYQLPNLVTIAILLSINLPTVISAQVCANFDDRCKFFANIGECRFNPNYMLRNCRAACGICGSDIKSVRDVENVLPPTYAAAVVDAYYTTRSSVTADNVQPSIEAATTLAPIWTKGPEGRIDNQDGRSTPIPTLTYNRVAAKRRTTPQQRYGNNIRGQLTTQPPETNSNPFVSGVYEALGLGTYENPKSILSEVNSNRQGRPNRQFAERHRSDYRHKSARPEYQQGSGGVRPGSVSGFGGIQPSPQNTVAASSVPGRTNIQVVVRYHPGEERNQNGGKKEIYGQKVASYLKPNVAESSYAKPNTAAPVGQEKTWFASNGEQPNSRYLGSNKPNKTYSKPELTNQPDAGAGCTLTGYGPGCNDNLPKQNAVTPRASNYKSTEVDVINQAYNPTASPKIDHLVGKFVPFKGKITLASTEIKGQTGFRERVEEYGAKIAGGPSQETEYASATRPPKPVKFGDSKNSRYGIANNGYPAPVPNSAEKADVVAKPNNEYGGVKTGVSQVTYKPPLNIPTNKSIKDLPNANNYSSNSTKNNQSLTRPRRIIDASVLAAIGAKTDKDAEFIKSVAKYATRPSIRPDPNRPLEVAKPPDEVEDPTPRLLPPLVVENVGPNRNVGSTVFFGSAERPNIDGVRQNLAKETGGTVRTFGQKEQVRGGVNEQQQERQLYGALGPQPLNRPSQNGYETNTTPLPPIIGSGYGGGSKSKATVGLGPAIGPSPGPPTAVPNVSFTTTTSVYPSQVYGGTSAVDNANKTGYQINGSGRNIHGNTKNANINNNKHQNSNYDRKTENNNRAFKKTSYNTNSNVYSSNSNENAKNNRNNNYNKYNVSNGINNTYNGNQFSGNSYTTSTYKPTNSQRTSSTIPAAQAYMKVMKMMKTEEHCTCDCTC